FFLARGQTDAGLSQVPDALIAARPAEHEVDRGQHALFLQARGRPLPAGAVDAPVPLPGSLDPGDLAPAVPASGPGAPLPDTKLSLVQRDQVGIRLETTVLFDVHVVQLPPDHVQ